MYHAPGPGTRLYRVTSAQPYDSVWPNPIQGLGAYYTRGGRYNRVHQQTVYCSDDPLVALTEAAFYQALDWQQRLSVHRINPTTYPFTSEHWLWSYSLNPAPPLIDLAHAHARHQFLFPPHLLLNPSRDYIGTRDLADDVRAYVPPQGSPYSRPEGLKAPSVRTPRRGGFQPSQFALFVMAPAVQQPYVQRATLLDQWRLTIEFQQLSPRQPVRFGTELIDWPRPRFRLGGPSHVVIPAFANRPGSRSYQLGRWYRLTIHY